MFTARWRDGMEWNGIYCFFFFFPNLILGFVNPGELEQLYSAIAVGCSTLHDCILRNFRCELYAYLLPDLPILRTLFGRK